MLKSIMTVFTTLAIGFPAVAQPLSTPLLLARSTPPKIGIVKNTNLIPIRGTYCDLQLVNDPSDFKYNVFLSAYYEQYQSKAVMNIDGKDVILTSIQETKNKRGFVTLYRGKNLQVKVNYLRTSPDIEGASYDATIIVTRDRRQTTLKTKGACGI